MKLFKPKNSPRVLIFDIETAPLEVLVWGLHDQNVTLGQVKKDRSVLSWAAKWLNSPANEVMYAGTGNQRNVRDDRAIMKPLHKLMSQADILITQNGIKFDEPIVKGRFLVHGLECPGPYRHIDTCRLARRMGFPSSKLEYLTQTLCPELVKLKHNEFPGNELWKECLLGNKKAWTIMEKYNKMDVLGTEGVYKKLAPFGVGVNFSMYLEGFDQVCSCGSTKWKKDGHAYMAAGKFQRYRCLRCTALFVEKGQANNKLSLKKRESMREC